MMHGNRVAIKLIACFVEAEQTRHNVGRRLTRICSMPNTAACPFLPPAASKLPCTSKLQSTDILGNSSAAFSECTLSSWNYLEVCKETLRPWTNSNKSRSDLQSAIEHCMVLTNKVKKKQRQHAAVLQGRSLL